MLGVSRRAWLPSTLGGTYQTMHFRHSPLPRGLSRFGFALWVLTLLLLAALGWLRQPLTVLLFLLLAYGAAFVLFMLLVIRYYWKRRNENRNDIA